MRVAEGLITWSLLAAAAWAADPGQPSRQLIKLDADMQIALLELEARAHQIYPRRRDTPLRALNISDDEVREVQTIARKYHMPELVNISPVVTGCPCEEGGACTEQVYITSRVHDRPVGLQLSRRKNLWTVGVVQEWWLEWAALRARERAMSFAEYQDARARLLLAMPTCPKPASSASPGSPRSIAENQSTR